MAESNFDDTRDDDIGDDLLRLVFTACHPVLSSDARVTLTLRLLGDPRRRLDAAGAVRGSSPC
jgi:predicted RNA polymerase sigma factor